MILRRWRGAVRPENAANYLEYQNSTGVREYRQTSGNRGVFILTRPVDGLIEVVTLSLWDGMDAVRAFAGENPHQAKFYPGDETLLAQKDAHADHYTVTGTNLDQSLYPGGSPANTQTP